LKKLTIEFEFLKMGMFLDLLTQLGSVLL